MGSYLRVVVARLGLFVGGEVILDRLLIDQVVEMALDGVPALRPLGGVLFQQLAEPLGVSLDRVDLV